MHTEARYSLVLIFLVLVMLLLSYFHAYMAIHLVYLFVGLFIIIYDRQLILFIYIFLFATNFFLPPGAATLGPVSGIEIMALLASYAGLTSWQESRKDPRFYEGDFFEGSGKHALLFAISLLVYMICTLWRDIMTGFNPQYEHLDLVNAVVYSLKRILWALPLYFIIRLAKFRYFRMTYVSAFFFSAIFLALGVIFSPLLLYYGILETDLSFDESGVLMRHEGFFGAGGDINSLAGFLGISCGFVISTLDDLPVRRVTTYIGLAIIVIAVVFSGSRAGILSFLAVVLLNFKFRNVVPYLAGLVILVLLVPRDILDFILERFHLLSSELDTSETGSRFFIWTSYFNYIADNPEIIFFGANKPLRLGLYHFVPHNFYLTVVYRWGIFPLILFSLLILKFIRDGLRVEDRKTRRVIFSVFIPLFIISNTVSDVGYFFAFILALAFIPVYGFEEEEEETEHENQEA
jgi:hypothetical protein